MTEDDLYVDIDDLERRMNGAIAALRKEFAGLRTGRASASMVDSIRVEAYGTIMPVNQCGTINIPEPRMITVSVWDKSLVTAVSNAIRDSGLGINPVVEGTVIRLPIPELNEERRRELLKVAAKHAEGSRVAIRNVRRSGNDEVRKAKNSGMSEDDSRLWIDEIQEITDKAVAEVDKALEQKKIEIMTV